jgi:hypothetical protein
MMPLGRPAAAMSVSPTALDRVTSPVRQASGDQPADPVGTLTGQPMQQAGPAYPPGSYPSPYYTDGPGCCGPMGRNGRIGSEVYLYTGMTWALGEGRLARELHTGIMAGGGGASLFFNREHDAAWIIDVGVSYQYNPGSRDNFQNIFLRQPPIAGTNTKQPDVLTSVAIRGLDRTNFNYAIGRDWWLWGPGSTGLENGWNLRVGGLLGGRWGTAHVDMIPQDDPTGYARRQGVTYGVFLAPRATVEIPLGSTILFGGVRTEWGYDWMNLVPPYQGNLHNINFVFTVGLRF